MRSAAPLSSKQAPTTAANAITNPTFFAAPPNSSATRVIFSPMGAGTNSSPTFSSGFIKLTTNAAVSNARKAFTFKPRINTSTTATPTARMTNGDMGAAGRTWGRSRRAVGGGPPSGGRRPSERWAAALRAVRCRGKMPMRPARGNRPRVVAALPPLAASDRRSQLASPLAAQTAGRG